MKNGEGYDEIKNPRINKRGRDWERGAVALGKKKMVKNWDGTCEFIISRRKREKESLWQPVFYICFIIS